MNNYEAHWLWYDFANVADSAIMRSKNVDSDDPYINWEKQEQSMRIAALSFACSILETLELKNNDSHTKILFHLRNAVLHNTGNIHNNRGKPKPYQECMKYLSDEKHYDVYANRTTASSKVYYTITEDGKVTIVSESSIS
ncbi:MAG: hypothetical protein RPU72_15265 [Candidatus Sedimenticola sp. (ex Thyasira tokunagai)]